MTGGFYGLGSRGRRAGTRAAWALLFSVPLLGLPDAGAQTLTEAWQRALLAEPSLQAAQASARAAAERTRQARAALLPQIDASYNRQRNRRTFSQITDSEEPEVETGERYPSRTAQLNITQPVWRAQSWAALAQAEAAEEQARYQREAAERDLQTRFVVAWFDLMAARDNVAHGAEQVRATLQQYEVMRRGLALGIHSDVQVGEAEARHQQALAERAAAEAEVDAKLALLEQLTGPMPGFTPPAWRLPDTGSLFATLQPLPQWLERAERENAAVRAAERALAAARAEVRRQQAAHQPTLDLVARHAHVLQGSGSSPGQRGYRSREHSVGVQLNVPLFAGGGTVARAREALALAEKAEADLAAAQRNAVAQARQAWAAAQAAQARAQAGSFGVRAAELALRAAVTGQGTGLKTPLDELQARQQLAMAHREEQRAHYDRVVGLARLRAAGGESAEALLAEVEHLLGAARNPSPATR